MWPGNYGYLLDVLIYFRGLNVQVIKQVFGVSSVRSTSSWIWKIYAGNRERKDIGYKREIETPSSITHGQIRDNVITSFLRFRMKKGINGRLRGRWGLPSLAFSRDFTQLRAPRGLRIWWSWSHPGLHHR
jgi:hypothetical protein